MVSEQSSFWSDLFDEVVRSKSSREHDLVQFGDAVPICAAWEVRPRHVLLVPPTLLSKPGTDGSHGTTCHCVALRLAKRAGCVS
jgi:hypothetical protein